MGKSRKNSIFRTDRKIRLGLWGLGRGMSFYKSCRALGIDVVAGCDYNEHMRKRFTDANPGAMATADAKEFLAADFDAVLLATFCPAHADDAIACLKAGKHVLSEVTAFHTMAEGVRLVEAVEKSGLVYNLAENYPFSAANMYLAAKWREGLFGEFMYAEYEYVHECRRLVYTYIDGVPVRPGNTVHNWRSWLSFHYYNTHSLGPVMHITGLRPTSVVSLPGSVKLAGYPVKDPVLGMGGVSPSLVTFENGGLMRNLMGSTTGGSHGGRIYGTLGSAEAWAGSDLHVRLGGSGNSPRMKIEPKWEDFSELAASTGHGGGDFWVLYYFARQILEGTSGPFDVYGASDCTIPGLLAYRSSVEGGRKFDVPDFRKKSERDRWRRDDFAQPRYDTRKGCFPAEADERLTGRFTTVMTELIRHATAYRAYADWRKLAGSLAEPERLIELADAAVEEHPERLKTYREARRLADEYPRSDAARVLGEMLEVGDEEAVTRRGALAKLKRERATLKRKLGRAKRRRN